MDLLTTQLNPQQKNAAEHTEGPLIIFAGAGTGKTRVIIYRIAYLLSKGVSPYRIIAVTFTNKAAEEMRKRIDALVPGNGRAVWISTFHSFCAQFLRTEAKHIGLDPNFLIYDDTDQKNVLKHCIAELTLDDKKFKPSRLAEIIGRSKDDMLDADSYQIHADTSGDSFRQVVAAVYVLYQQKLKQTGALDFGDLLLNTVRVLHDNELIRQKYQERFQYVMIDEYQDTNHAQYLLAKYLSAKHRNICVVGDDDQSIYSWRGADIRNILEFEKDYPNCQMVKLEENYRSSSNILDSAWHVIRNNDNRVEKKLWTKKEGGNPIKLMESENALMEAQNIVGEIGVLRNKNACSLNEFAVFYRTNAQSRILEDAFRREGLPYRIVGTLRFYERAEVKDILAYLRLVHNPNDNVSFRRVVNNPRRGIGKTALLALEAAGRLNNTSLWEALKNLPALEISNAGRKAFLSFRDLLHVLRLDQDKYTVKEIAEQILEKTGYITLLQAEDTPEAQNKIENIYELIAAIEEFEGRSADKTLAGYLTQVALVQDIDDLAETEERATLMTLHLAKGLEFNHVFIAGLEEGLFPIGESAFDRDDLEEERRLMYVGMTRAKENLYLSWAHERTVFGKTHWNMPSRFIQEAGITGMAQKDGATPELKTVVYENIDTHSLEHGQHSSVFPLESRVKHEKFGFGKVIDKSGSGEDLKVVVLFDSGQWKKLAVKYANLEAVED